MKPLTSALAAAALFTSAWASASDTTPAPVIEKFSDGLLIEPVLSERFVRLNLRVYDGQGREVLASSSLGEPLEVLAGNLDDGDYRFEAVTVSVDDAAATVAARETGTFRVQAGQLVQPDLAQAGLSVFNAGPVQHGLVAVLDVLIRSAAALDVTGPSPEILFKSDNTADPDTDWALIGDDTSFDLVSYRPGALTHTVFSFPWADEDIHDSLVVDGSGNISLADSSIWIDRGNDRLGIGTLSPDAALDIHGANPVIELFDEAANESLSLQHSGTDFVLSNNTGLPMFSVALTGDDPLVLDERGYLGVAGFPTTALDIYAEQPEIRLYDESTSQSMSLRHQAGRFSVLNNAGVEVIDIDGNAPVLSLNLSADGFLGVGPGTGETELHIASNQPVITLQDNSQTKTAKLGYDGNFLSFGFSGGGQDNVMQIEKDAPGGSVLILSDGTVFIPSLDADFSQNPITTNGLNINTQNTAPAQISLVEDAASLRWIMGSEGQHFVLDEFDVGRNQATRFISIAPRASSNRNSVLKVDGDGDIRMAGGDFFLKMRSSQFERGLMGLGTAAPLTTLHLRDWIADMRLESFPAGEYVEFEFNRDILEFKMFDGDLSTVPFKIARPQADLLTLIQDRVVTQGDLVVTQSQPGEHPEFRFYDSDSNDSVEFQYSNNFLRIKGLSGQDLGKIHADAPVGTFTTDARGRTGYGTANPAASLNVKYRSAHGSVPVMLLQKPNNDEIFKVNFNGDTFVNGALVHSSDREAKTKIRPVDNSDILQKVAGLPISFWQYKSSEGVDHIGPMAQDFHAAFGLGDTDRGIATVDMDGVALAAIKALSEENQALRALVTEAMAENRRQDQELTAMRSDRQRLEKLEAAMTELLSADAAASGDLVR